MTDEQLKAIWQRWERATPGEWKTGMYGDDPVVAMIDGSAVEVCLRPDDYLHDGDMDFIANAHQDIPALRAHIEALTAENERLKKQVVKLERKATAGDDLLYAMDRLVP